LSKAKRSVDAKAEQLETSLKYKTEFFSNMSHELRTPLNSLLILSGLLRDNEELNLTAKQVQYASVIHTSGSNLLRLFNGILELASVESGTAVAEIGDVALIDIRDPLHSEFDAVANDKPLSFSVELANGLPEVIATDTMLLRQVLSHLLANAFKFTEHGGVTVDISSPARGWNPTHETLSHACTVIAFAVSDTGIGIPPEIHQRIFEDFVQGDGSTARHYGGTGLGLSISAKLVALLHGEITVASTAQAGSTFVVYLPDAAETALIAA
jgi:signal transduction histidine kinase